MIEAKRTFNKQLVRDIITHPDIFKTIAEDGFKLKDVDVNCVRDCWLVMDNGSQVVGVYKLHPHNSTTLQIHAHVLPEYRKEHSQDTGIEALRWILEEGPREYEKVIAIIPCIYENVKRFTCSQGFIVEGINRKSYRKNGRIVDQWLLGITRDEIRELLHESEAA